MRRLVSFARSESHYYDFVASWITDDDTRRFAPVQLKEIVPAELNSLAALQTTIDSLPSKYVDSEDLTVAIYLNRQLHFDPSTLRIPKMAIAGLWIFGAVTADQSKWGLWGNFLESQPQGTLFAYPA